jgi:trk system potassium uptake protein TrkA
VYVIVAGCGSLGAELALRLSEDGEDVVVVDRDRRAFERLGPEFDGLTVEGIPIDADVLRQAGGERADALAAVTDSDQVNLMVGQLASRILGIPRVVVQVSDPQLEDTYRRFGVTTMRPGRSTVGQVRSLLGAAAPLHLAAIGTGEAHVSMFTPGRKLVGESLDRLTIPGKCQPIGVLRLGSVRLAEPGLTIQPGDAVLVAVRLDAQNILNAWADAPSEPSSGEAHRG